VNLLCGAWVSMFRRVTSWPGVALLLPAAARYPRRGRRAPGPDGTRRASGNGRPGFRWARCTIWG